MSPVKINTLNFWRRVSRLHRIWTEGRDNESNPFFDLDAFCVLSGKSDDEAGVPLSELVLIHLLGIAFTDTLFVMTEEKLYIVASAKKLQMLAPIAQSKQGVLTPLEVELFEKSSEPEVMKKTFDKILEAVHGSFSGSQLGVSLKEKPSGVFSTTWLEVVEADSCNSVELDACLYAMLAYQDEYESMIMQDSATVAARAMKKSFAKQLMDIVEAEKSVPHSTIAKKVEEAIRNNGKLEADLTDASFFPTVQSGKSGFKLALGAPSNDEPMSYDIVMCSLGVEYKQYNTHLARTYLIDPTKAQQKAYKLLLSIQDDIISRLRPGAKLGALYTSALEKIKAKQPQLAPYFLKSAGWGTGLSFPNKHIHIKAGSTAQVRQRMSFSVCVGFEGVPLDDDVKNLQSSLKDGTYSLMIADTVYVDPEETKVLTMKSSKESSKVTFMLNDEEEEEVKTKKDVKDLGIDQSLIIDAPGGTRGRATRSSVKSAEDRELEEQAHSNELKIQEHQVELMAKKARIANKFVSEDDNVKEEEKQVEIVTAYQSPASYPGDLQRNMIYCDTKHESVLLPIGGSHVPFHISTIKSISKNEEEKATYLRFNFYYPTGSGSFSRDTPKEARELMTQHPDLMYIKEMSFRSRDPRNLNQQLRLVKELQKTVRARDKKREIEADLVEQASLIISRSGPRVLLHDVNMRPSLGKRKCVGSLVAHTNGVRFKTNRGEILDIIFSNVKHFFYQSCKGELIVLVHFHLKHPIMIGRTKTYDVQFYLEVVEGSTGLNGRRRDYDPDEVDEENREREIRKKRNAMFKRFAKNLLDFAEKNNQRIGKGNDLEVPYREEHFKGVPFKEMVKLTPTLNCLVNLSETPFFVVDLDEVEHIHFERADFRISKAFDMVIILKKHLEQDCTDIPQRVSAIDMKDFDKVRNWIDSTRKITFSYSGDTFNWKKIMESVRDEIERGVFWEVKDEDGEDKELGWNFLKVTAEQGGGDEEDDEEESEYEGSSDDGEEEDEEDDYEEDEEEEEEESEGYEDDEEEEGLSWEEMERQAAREDKKKSFDRDDDRDRSRSRKRR